MVFSCRAFVLHCAPFPVPCSLCPVLERAQMWHRLIATCRHGHNGQASAVLEMGEITGLAQALRQPKFLIPISPFLEPVAQRVALGLCHIRSLVVG